ncbi:uncharacterized protein LOC100210485 [Hydra vulgaris]|uniref:uncharacterized protein LOC100210485 n=1 Tax=Hydra vulgaris TaxID=6087 RepID=UPI000641704C|nr:uncharacterized protein LOC100210485 [Hydra vulgaris]XP_047126416.1 uncharacterized protein LOC100210485 [Hydra vulgaris]XP_047126417.1 uncharacterized protein LOC100210485 [Hydra vulgaris]XP_047126418.1 uncharacterized protein LOC100210485 [Hydra vulgaris]XP_047126419.1 uncharacterized protein LOC100210485 [Hydra vulgaris]
MRWLRLLCLLWLLSFIVLISIIWINLHKKIEYNNWIYFSKEYMIDDFTELQRIQKKNLSACVLPSLNAFSQDVKRFIKPVDIKCSVKRYGKVTKDGWYFLMPLDNNIISNVSIRYIYRHKPSKDYINEDFAVKLSDPTYVSVDEKGYFKHKLEDDFIKVDFYVNDVYHFEYHAHISYRSQEEFRKTAKKRKDVNGLGLDVVFLMIDSQSNANFHRQLKKTTPQLLKDQNTIILNGHTIVGDGTTAQLAAILIGEHEKNLPESRRSMPNSGTCDQFNFIFKDLHKAGYLTMFSEDDPQWNTFHYRLHGFNNLPTSWYLRPFWLAQNPSAKCDVEYNNILLKTFTEVFEDFPKVSLVINSAIGHNDINALQVIDDDILEIINYFKNPIRIDHTILIIFGDHGARVGEIRSTVQGKLEERLPFLSITLPPDFKIKYPKIFAALKKNSNILTSHFDIYASLQHMLSYPDLPNKTFIGQSLFTEIDPGVRTCKNSGVEDHWCPCLNYKTLSVAELMVINVTQAVVNFINGLIHKNEKAQTLCSNLTVQTILSAGLKTPKNEVTQFIKTNRNKDCDSCGVVYDTSIAQKQYYEVIFTVYPSNGAFEANADVLTDNTIVVDPNISRINLYGNQSHCILNDFPHLRPYCYCV